MATERWAALVDDDGWGLGVFKDDGGEFHGGIHGDARSDDPKHGSTAYVAPIHVENFDHNIVYEHRTEFVVGKLADIRKRFNEMATKTPPAWRFVKDRQHWTMRDATDQGFPMNGEWRIKFGASKPRLESAIQCWRAESAPAMDLEIAYTGPSPRPPASSGSVSTTTQYDSSKSLPPGAEPRWQVPHVSSRPRSSPEYRDLIIGVAIEPVAQPRPGEEIAIKSIVLSSGSK